MEKVIVLSNRISEVGRLAGFVSGLGQELNLGPELVFQLNLALEEAVSNVIMYAYPEGQEEEIRLSARQEGKMLVFTLTDSGREFDPTGVSSPDISLPAEEREAGGLGIFLVRQIMDGMSYRREDGKNVLTLRKQVEEKDIEAI